MRFRAQARRKSRANRANIGGSAPQAGLRVDWHAASSSVGRMMMIQKSGDRDQSGRMNVHPALFPTESCGPKLTNNHLNQTKP
jgi:hypothetical protein